MAYSCRKGSGHGRPAGVCDQQGYLDGETLRAAADELGCFSISRPEDVHENPKAPTEVVFASTGRQSEFPTDNCETLYVVDVETADLKILLDSNGEQFKDFGLRSADNLVWVDNGKIYVLEDRSIGGRVPKDLAGYEADADPVTCRDEAFGGRSKIEASIWEIDPYMHIQTIAGLKRVAVMTRAAVLPENQVDTDPLDLGDWESSTIIDVTEFFRTKKARHFFLVAPRPIL